ncbi:MAG: mucoidy inhibitor MuiA family protein [Deltaproteobacteria bacterium]|nr:mucoidy inhibitor MuiA family protein [Deltaproteobacteria bacterium]
MLLKSTLIHTVLFLGVVPTGAIAGDTVKTAISLVTVYADRARVTRTGRVELPAEPTHYSITGLPGFIDAESLRVTLDPPVAGTILDVAVEPSFLLEASDEAVRKAEANVREVEDKVAALDDEEKVLAGEVARLEALRVFTVDKLPKELATRDVPVKSLAETLEFVTETLRRDQRLLREVAAKRRDLAPELAKRTQERHELNVRAQLRQSTVSFDLKGKGTATLSVTYLIPGATWEPVGDLRVTSAGEKVTLSQYASVLQTTGEDWVGATLAFSTQRPGDVLGIPKARTLLLGASGSGLGDVLSQVGESFERARAAYSAQSQVMAGKDVRWQTNLVAQRAIEARVTETFSRLAQRGTTAHFAALSPRTVRADGQPVRILIAEREFSARLELVAVPEVSLNSVRTARIVNRGSQAILPGRFSLFEDSAFVGISELDFVAPGESFSAFLGVDEQLKLERAPDRSRTALDRGSKRTKLTVSFVVSVENLSDRPRTLQLTDRVPVAQLDEIELDDVETPNKVEPDPNGVIRWSAMLAPRQKLAWRVGFTLEYPSDLLQRSRSEAKPRFNAAPSNYEDIQQLEDLF